MANQKYVVKQEKDGVGFYVEKSSSDGLSYTVHGVSMNITEMEELAKKLNDEAAE